MLNMFFFIAIMPIKKVIPYMFSSICKNCSKVCNYEIIMTANCLSIFFIPVFKWGKQYFVQTNCCGSLFSLKKEVGDAIYRGENITITDNDISLIDENFGHSDKCPYCGGDITDYFDYCPKCGRKL